ncbi:bromodomain and WD repeat-containing protein 3 isoform X2 [Aphidius gifuensis]|uniref:bromodomain and WD repeat-containing protein 3 isoform X2 n=1 Tax=Aphidius gifuensis TaxID=684658 RepID=UPI001CDD8095|nr:bromodomain and WD repeat-containing protein 3 isoform X2 [Aphidius gifuensis]
MLTPSCEPINVLDCERKYPHISANHLLQICTRIGPILEKEIPPCVPGAISLLGAGKQSLLRTKEDLSKYRRSIVSYSNRLGGQPILEPADIIKPHNIVQAIQGRENSGPISRREAIPTSFYSRMQLYRHTLGHLSAVYCILYDRTGKYVITGADDLLVKVWSTLDGRLLATFRGASAEIMDIAVNFDNSLLAAGSLDRIIRVWCFQTMSPIAVLSGHSGKITSVNFCPISCSGNVYYLVSTSTDGSVAFWSHIKKQNERAVFQPKPIQYHEKMRPGQAQMICASFSPGGAFMAAGSADHHVRVYAMLGEEGPRRVLEVEAHTDTVDSIQWAHNGLKFISGSKDGTANVWQFKNQQWIHKRLSMTTKLPNEQTNDDDNKQQKPKVTMVSWDLSDEWVITAVNDSLLKVWNAKNGELVKVLRGHKDEVFVLESHPIDPRIILSAGHDGQLMIWDVLLSEPIACFQNFIEGQGCGAIFDAKWSPDGTLLSATDSHGHLLMYGLGTIINDKLKLIPKELFFHTDYRPLIRDSNNYVLDEQTQTAPHLMPPPFLVDVDGNPYPPLLQRIVPGRERCRGEQLVPNIAVGASGMQEVIEGIPDRGPRSDIDRLIEALAQRRNIPGHENDGDDTSNRDDNEQLNIRQISSPRASRPGLRRDGDVEGVRQSVGNWQRDNTTPWNKPILVKTINPAIQLTQLKLLHSMATNELDIWKKEMKKSIELKYTNNNDNNINNKRSSNSKRKNHGIRHGYRTRATRDNDDTDNDNDNQLSESSMSNNSNDSTANEEDMSSDSTSSESSSEYSDWIADRGLNLEPPKRSKRKPVKKRSSTPPESDNSNDNNNHPCRRSQRPKKKIITVPNGIGEVPEQFRPSEWLTEVIPRKAPYYPQMGDEIVYFRQGHKFYIDAVKNKKVYELGQRFEPWNKIKLKPQEYVKVVGIKYEIRPPRLCCLKLALMDDDGCLTGSNFTIKYHDMADVLDFLVLRQTFETALQRSWSEGDRFRCMIDDGWWMGIIESVEPLDDEFTESYFMCFRVRWDNGEYEKMSPWDLEPIDQDRLPNEIGGAVPVSSEEIQATLYQPQSEEWPMGDREATCRRISRGIDQVMTLAIAEPFITPVDLNIYPGYAFVVEYPIDLSTIKARLENHFYRRITSAQFDVRYLATNAEQFNESHSQIVKAARIVTDLCLRIIKETTEIDVPAVYHQLMDTYQSSDSELDVVDDHSKPSTSRQRSSSGRCLRSQKEPFNWKVSCRKLLETLWQCEDSIPFREPVDRLEHPDYYQVIDTPMDLRTVKEDMLGDNYETPLEFAKDMKLIFTNSKCYNTNKRSKIYLMTIRLSGLFDEHMKMIISEWKSAQRSSENAKSKSKTKANGNTRQSKNQRLTNGGAGPSTANDIDSSSDEEEIIIAALDDEDDDDNDGQSALTEQILPNINDPGPSRITNGHVKTPIKTPIKTPGRSTRSQTSKNPTPKKLQEMNSDLSESEASLESESSDSAPARRKPVQRKRKTSMTSDDNASDDSGDSYKPSCRGKQTRKNRAKNSKKGKINKVKKSFVVNEEEDDEEEEEEEEDEEHLIDPEHTDDEDDDDSEEEIMKKRKPPTRSKKIPVKKDRLPRSISDNDNSDDETSDSDDDDDDDEDDNDNNIKNNNIKNSLQDVQDSNSNDSMLNDRMRRSQNQNRVVYGDSDASEEIQHSRRNCKRPRYNEESEDSENAPVRNRRQVKRRYYAEESDESIPEPGISISSRGRVRKLTPRARAFLLESPP